MKDILRPTHKKRMAFFLFADIIFIILSLYIAFLFRFDFSLPIRYLPLFKKLLPLFLVVKIVIFWIFNLYNITWKYVGLYDFFNIIKASFISTTVIGIIIYFLKHPYFSGTPRSIIVIDFFTWLFLASIIRISKRFFLEFVSGKSAKERGLPTMIIGAQDVGETIVRDMIRTNVGYTPVCFVDEDPSLQGSYIHGIPVCATPSQIPTIVKGYGIKVAIIAIPSINKNTLRRYHDLLLKSGVEEIKLVPNFYEGQKKEISVKDLKDIKIEDLLGREEVKIDTFSIEQFLKQKRVLVTGAAGSIGSEISKQVLMYSPEKLVLFEIDETRLFELENSLLDAYPERESDIVSIIGDIRDKKKLDKIFSEFRPQIVFHAAAYKHVPLMERHPEEAVKTNILGTYNLAEASVKYDVKKFVLISTDKAVNPKNVMGWSKKIAEDIIRAFGKEGKTEFIAVRFGNVLGSRGSVLPIFLSQIKKGGPVTVTDPRMKRYFMTIPEAVALVLEASVIGKNGQVLILDMGEPVNILDLAEELIKLHGLVPGKDVKIKITGARPGEKLFEELMKDTENLIETTHERIFVVRANDLPDIREIERLIEQAKSPNFFITVNSWHA